MKNDFSVVNRKGGRTQTAASSRDHQPVPVLGTDRTCQNNIIFI